MPEDTEALTAPISIRLSTADYDMLVAGARSLGVPVAVLIRSVIHTALKEGVTWMGEERRENPR